MTVRSRSLLQTWWRRQQFEPGWAGVLVNPFVFARRGLWRELTGFLAHVHGELLDVGCGRKPYRDFVRATRYVGVDIDTPASRALGCADVFYDGETLPFPGENFDTVLCSQVLEHVFEPEAFLREIRRVLRPGGQLVLSVPFAWDEHEQPRDYARYSSFGLRALLQRTGIEVIALRKVTTGSRALAQLTSGWLFKVTYTESKWLRLVAQFVVIAPVNIVGAVAGAILPAGDDFYLDNVVLARAAAAPLA
jgi:SAM-dependent methyltransferase